jgi:hypothetical protein
LFDVTTTIPGFLEKGDVTEDEFNKESPQVMIKNEMIFLKYCSTFATDV